MILLVNLIFIKYEICNLINNVIFFKKEGIMRFSFFTSILFTFFLIQSKKAIIFGVSGQDGSYLSEFLLSNGYEVHGVKRRSSSFNTSRLDPIYKDLHNKTNFYLHYGDLGDSSSVFSLIQEILPDEIYNLGAQSHVRVSFDIPEYTADVVGLGALRILESIRLLKKHKDIKYYQASSSEMFGKVQEVPQSETTPFYPRSPYGVSKLFAYWITVNYRESYGIFACNGILFNHESPRRGETFVTRKITRAVSAISKGNQDILYLGNLDSKRDWGFAGDYVKAMWLMLQQDQPEDFVIATGEMHSVREFVEIAFKKVGIKILWRGSGLDEVGVESDTGKILVKIDSRYFRPAEVDILIGNMSKAKDKLGWEPQVTFDKLIQLMMDSEL